MSHTHRMAWCAGFFDGEGYVTIQRRNAKAPNGKTYTGHYLRVGINHVAPEPLYEIQKLLGGKVIYRDNVTGNRHPRYVWCLNCASAKEALVQLLPYLINKREVALLGIEFQNTMQDNKKTVSVALREQREQYRNMLIALNEQD